VKRCVICNKPLPSGRSKYCGKPCYFASKKGFMHRRYHADPAFVAKQKTAVHAWRRANRDYYNAHRRDLYARKKAAHFAAVLRGVSP
jgi:hypothetical protein